MKTHITRPLLLSALVGASALTAQASTDYGPAIWHPICNANWYSTGYGHKFFVEHDMEGYYASVVNWFDNCSMSSASVHFAVNGKQDATSDAPEGEITQLGVRTAQYAWHALCWNQHSLGTEHEGFASNPAWYTDPLYRASASCTAAMANAFGFAKDRNHVVGHGEKSNANWVAYANANLGINATCNTHTDPGPYWNWSLYMSYVNGGGNNASVVSASHPTTVSPGQTFTATVTMNNNGGTTWTSDATPHGLGSANPQDNTTWRASNRVGLPGTIAPGQNAAFTFTCTAPAAEGTYTFAWQMVEDGVQWFGATYSTTITVAYVNNASVVSMSYPSTVSPGQSFSASVTMNNNGTKTWNNTDGTAHRLGSQNPQDNTRWGTGRVEMPVSSVAPGQNVTFTYTFTAPTTAGAYAFDWQMVEDGVQWFGATATGTINVVNPEYIVDNGTSGYVDSANWITGTSATQKYGADYRYRSTAAVSDAATWTANLSLSGNHNVYAWWSAGANRSATAPYIVYHAAGSTTVNVNQQANGGVWNLLGTFNMNTGNNNVKLSCWTTTGFIVLGDAVRWVRQ